MRPVNLLPGEFRPRRASGALSGSAYVVVAGLAGLLLLVGLYVFTANKVTSRENETVEALEQTQAAEAKIKALGAYGDFATVAQQRSVSVKRIAAGRFDWERLTRELAVILPENVWLTEVDASVAPETAATAATTDAATSQVTGPSAKLVGCAKNQPDVAKLMVRLRQMHRVDDVQLKESAVADTGGSEGSGGSSASAAAVSSDGCGKTYAFELTVVFDEQSPAGSITPGGESPRVPARLGGGQ